MISSKRATLSFGRPQPSITVNTKSASTLSAAMRMARAEVSFDSSEAVSITTGMMWPLSKLPTKAMGERLSPFSRKPRAFSMKGRTTSR